MASPKSSVKLKKGLIRLYTGDGQGKTTAALGVALRAYGHGLRVTVLHFLKGYEDVGEMHFAKGAGERWVERMFRHTKKPFIDLDQILANKAEFAFACERAIAEVAGAYINSDVLVLDEVTNAEASGVLPLDLLLQLVDQKPRDVELILTGRMAHASLIERADYVTNMTFVKHPFYCQTCKRAGTDCQKEPCAKPKVVWARKGVDY